MFGSPRNPSKSAFTLVELLVVIAIIGVLMALLIPAVQAARETARQATCTTNLTNLGKAMAGHALNKGHFPGMVQLKKTARSVDLFLGTSESDIDVSWAAVILPDMDSQAIWDSILTDPTAGGMNINEVPQLEFFLCPSNALSISDAPGLTYNVNSGIPDVIPAPGGQSDFAANGICHNRINVPGFEMNGPKVRYGTDIKDGSSTTLMISENSQKDEPGFSRYSISWLRSDAIGIEPSHGEQLYGLVWVYEGNPDQLAVNNPGIQERISKGQENEGNSYTEQGVAFTRPGSEHPGLFIAVFAEGNVKSISDEIEYRVYQQLMTPNGSKAQWHGQNETQNQAMRNVFNQPPYSVDDLNP